MELGIALAMLLVTLMASLSVIGGARRNERAMWDELIAGQLVTSALEQALVEEKLEVTPPEGRAVEFSNRQRTQLLPELKVTLFVTHAEGRDDLCELKAVVTWQSEPSASDPIMRTVEQTSRRRRQQN
jgi:hypothetical protein